MMVEKQIFEVEDSFRSFAERMLGKQKKWCLKFKWVQFFNM